MSDAFTPAELRKLRSLKNPHGIQRLLDDMPYHLADTAWSPRRVLRENTSHCFEGAMFAASKIPRSLLSSTGWVLYARTDRRLVRSSVNSIVHPLEVLALPD